jgi:hypothetical protein
MPTRPVREPSDPLFPRPLSQKCLPHSQVLLPAHLWLQWKSQAAEEEHNIPLDEDMLRKVEDNLVLEYVTHLFM